MEYRSRALVILVVLLIANRVVVAESKEAKIKRALSAAPPNVASGAKIVDMDEKGNMTVLRDGHNGFTCVAGHVGVVGDGPACMDAAGLQWTLDWTAHKPKPTNTQPGIIYQLAGDCDWSAADPRASSGTPHKWPPGWLSKDVRTLRSAQGWWHVDYVGRYAIRASDDHAETVSATSPGLINGWINGSPTSPTASASRVLFEVIAA